MNLVHETDMETLWERLLPEERRCVLAYRVYGTKAEAVHRIGKNKKWVEYNQRAHPCFRAAMDSEEWTLREITDRFTGDLVGVAFVRLLEMMESDALKPQQQLAAIKSAFQIAKSLGVGASAL